MFTTNILFDLIVRREQLKRTWMSMAQKSKLSILFKISVEWNKKGGYERMSPTLQFSCASVY